MRYVGSALVVVALIGADVLGGMGLMSARDARSWSMVSTLGLVLFIALIVFGREGDR